MEFVLGLFFIVLFGLVLGSFLTCITYRMPYDLSFLNGRSMCPKCKRSIAWYDNIPVLSYLVLGGKCRSCKVGISMRYPLIELLTAVLFGVFYCLYFNCVSGNYFFCSWNSLLGVLALPFVLFNVLIIIAVFVIDLEHQIIPDELVFLGFVVSFVLFFVSGDMLFERLLAGFASAVFLLVLHIATHGRGMGLGDVKFAIYAGFLLMPLPSVFWMFTAFILGSIVGLALICLGKAKFGAKIAFGPFLAASLIITLITGSSAFVKFLPIF